MRSVPRRPDAHTLLGVPITASRAEIRRAYRKRALEIHPDVAGRDTTAEMAALNHARDQLLAAAGERGSSADAGVGTSATPGSASARRPHAAPEYSHTPTWDDYWSAWNDPPRRPPR